MSGIDVSFRRAELSDEIKTRLLNSEEFKVSVLDMVTMFRLRHEEKDTKVTSSLTVEYTLEN